VTKIRHKLDPYHDLSSPAATRQSRRAAFEVASRISARRVGEPKGKSALKALKSLISRKEKETRRPPFRGLG
jgi:hypothetical protein